MQDLHIWKAWDEVIFVDNLESPNHIFKYRTYLDTTVILIQCIKNLWRQAMQVKFINKSIAMTYDVTLSSSLNYIIWSLIVTQQCAEIGSKPTASAIARHLLLTCLYKVNSRFCTVVPPIWGITISKWTSKQQGGKISPVIQTQEQTFTKGVVFPHMPK